jgi:hypothetical protein
MGKFPHFRFVRSKRVQFPIQLIGDIYKSIGTKARTDSSIASFGARQRFEGINFRHRGTRNRPAGC